MTQVFKLEGAKELARALEELPKATARNVLKRVLTKAGKPVEAAMIAGAPRDTGFTAGSIGVSARLNPAQRREAKKEGKFFAEVYVGSTRGSAAVFQEFGTVDQPAHPYMRPAWDANKEGVLRVVETELGGEISKAAARLARKAAKLAAG